MKVTKCDRCGKTWRFSESCGTRHDGHFLITWARSLGRKERDLCMDCMDDFEKFMSVGTETEHIDGQTSQS